MYVKDLVTKWRRRFLDFKRAFRQLDDAVNIARERQLTRLEEQGIIQMFEFTHELAWNVIKEYLESQGTPVIMGSVATAREAFNRGLINDGKGWMDMVKSSNETFQTYNEEMTREMVHHILDRYIFLFEAFQRKMEDLNVKEPGTISFA